MIKNKLFLTIITSFFLAMGHLSAQEISENTAEKTVKIKVTGMTCAGCAKHVYDVLSETQGVTDNSVEYPGDIAIVKYNPDKIKPDEIVKAIEQNTSYTAKLMPEEKQGS